MKKIIIPALLAVFSLSAHAQTYDEILSLVKSSAQLRAVAVSVQAQKDETETDLLLPNPEVELGYQLGDPHKTVPNRTQVTVTQEFDYATLSGRKSAVAKQKQRLLDCEYDVAVWQKTIEARQLLAELTYCNIRLRELQRREEQASALAEAYRSALEKGAATILDANKAEIEKETCRADRKQAEAERQAKLSELAVLCNKDIDYSDTVYHCQQLPTDFDQWFTTMQFNHPQCLQSAQTVILSQENVLLEKAKSKPSISFGYSGEMVRGNNYHGVVVGFSIPLWGNKQRMKAANSAVREAEEQRKSEQIQLCADYRQQYLRAHQFRQLAIDTRKTLDNHDNRPLLVKALNAGRISLIDYLQELSYCYALTDKLQEAERDAAISAAVF